MRVGVSFVDGVFEMHVFVHLADLDDFRATCSNRANLTVGGMSQRRVEKQGDNQDELNDSLGFLASRYQRGGMAGVHEE